MCEAFCVFFFVNWFVSGQPTRLCITPLKEKNQKHFLFIYWGRNHAKLNRRKNGVKVKTINKKKNNKKTKMEAEQPVESALILGFVHNFHFSV